MSDVQRIVCWFSCGAASAVATKLAIAENAGKHPLVIAYTEALSNVADAIQDVAEAINMKD